MSYDNFWDEMVTGSFVPTGGDTFNEHLASAKEKRMKGREMLGSHTTALQELTDVGRAKSSLPLPVVAGTRVAFKSNVGSILTYDDVPDAHVMGTVVTVRTAEGDTTHYNGRVFVSWDDGIFRPICPEHLKQAPSSMKMASNFRIVTSSLGDISAFFAKTAEDDLIHKATKDIWSLKTDGSNYVLERLFDDTGAPLKV